MSDSIIIPAVSRKYKIGQEVIGHRSPDHYTGTLVRTYATKNGPYKNMAYVVKCNRDGKERSFQGLSDNT